MFCGMRGGVEDVDLKLSFDSYSFYTDLLVGDNSTYGGFLGIFYGRSINIGVHLLDCISRFCAYLPFWSSFLFVWISGSAIPGASTPFLFC